MDITIPCQGFVRPAANGPEPIVAQDRLSFAFDDNTVETVRSALVALPASYDPAHALKADIFYNAVASSGNFGAHIAVEAVTPGDALNLQTTESWDSNNSGSVAVPATAGHLGVLTITLSDKDNAEPGDCLRLRLQRNTSVSGDATGDVRVFAVRLYTEAP